MLDQVREILKSRDMFHYLNFVPVNKLTASSRVLSVDKDGYCVNVLGELKSSEKKSYNAFNAVSKLINLFELKLIYISVLKYQGRYGRGGLSGDFKNHFRNELNHTS
jgi:hypothetical protein